MSDLENPFDDKLRRAMGLRWTLRDIHAKRLKLSPADPGHLKELIDTGLVEMIDEQPVLTKAGLDAIS